LYAIVSRASADPAFSKKKNRERERKRNRKIYRKKNKNEKHDSRGKERTSTEERSGYDFPSLDPLVALALPYPLVVPFPLALSLS